MQAKSKVLSPFERLNLLLANNQRNIIQREQDNAGCVHLYSVGAYWVAFDRSAYMLGKLVHGGAEPTVLRLKEYPLPILMCYVPQQQVNDLCSGNTMTQHELDYLQLSTPAIESRSYSKWYRSYTRTTIVP